MLKLTEAPIDTVAPVHFGCVDHESSPARPPAVPAQPLNGGLGFLRALAGVVFVAGIALIAIFSAEVAHDLCTRVGFTPAGDGPGTEAEPRTATYRSGSSGQRVQEAPHGRPFRPDLLCLYGCASMPRGRGSRSRDPRSPLRVPVFALPAAECFDGRP